MASGLNNSAILRLRVLASDSRSTVPPQQRSRRPRRRQSSRRDRRGYRIIAATAHEVTYPKLPTISFLKQSRLIEHAQAGDVEARNTVWVHNARLAYSAVAQFNFETDLLADALQEAQLGLSRAIEKFEIDRLNALSTYAFYWLKQAALRMRSRQAYATTIPSHHWDRFRRFRHLVVLAPSRREWFDEREKLLDEDPKAYHQIVRVHAVACPDRLQKEPGLISIESNPLDRIVHEETIERLMDLIEQLDPRLNMIVNLRFLCESDESDRTLKEIGRELGLTRERVRQLQNEALELLRVRLEDTLPASQIEPKPGEQPASGSNTMLQQPEIEDHTT